MAGVARTSPSGRRSSGSAYPLRGLINAPPPTSPTAVSTPSSRPAPPPASRSRYLLPSLHAIETSRGPKGQRGASVLYLAPTKALAQDQLATLRRLGQAGLPDLRCSTHDGDSTPEMREWTRDHGEYVLTNPDMLHRSLLPGTRALVALLRVAALRGRRRVPPLPRRLRRPRRPDPAAASARRGALRRPSDLRARLRDGRGAGDLGRPADRARGRRGHRRRLTSRPHRAGPVGAAVRARGRRERRARTPLGRQRGRRPAHRPRGRAGPHPRLRPVPTWSRDRRHHGPEAARRGRPQPGRPGGGLPWRLPARGAPRARAGAARRSPPRPGRDQRARARHRHQRPRRRAPRRLPRHPRRAVAAGGPGRARRSRRAGRDGGARRPAGHLPGQPPRGAARPARGGQRLRPGQPLRAGTRTCAPRRRSHR